jgi:DNA polymerase-3 subunit epsilon
MQQNQPRPTTGQRPAGRDIVVFDTETTGVSAEDRVVSLGAVRLCPALGLRRSLHLVFNPGRDSHWAAERVHGLSAGYLAVQPPFGEHVAEVRDFFAGAALAAHNLDFDTRMLDRELSMHGAPPLARPPGTRCTLREWRARSGGRSGALDSAIAHLGLTRQGRVHGAFEDAVLAASVLRWLEGVPHDPCGVLIPPSNERPAWPEPAAAPAEAVLTLAGKRVVLTGELNSMGRDEAAAVLARCGARRQTAPNRLTDYVVVGAAPGPAKLRAIRELQAAGGRPQVLQEAAFLRLAARVGA